MDIKTIISSRNEVTALILRGDLNFKNAADVYRASLNYLLKQSDWNIDFSEVRSNSVGVALMVEWIKMARHHHKKLTFVRVPENLTSIAEVAGLKELIFPYIKN